MNPNQLSKGKLVRPNTGNRKGSDGMIVKVQGSMAKVTWTEGGRNPVGAVDWPDEWINAADLNSR